MLHAWRDPNIRRRRSCSCARSALPPRPARSSRRCQPLAWGCPVRRFLCLQVWVPSSSFPPQEVVELAVEPVVQAVDTDAVDVADCLPKAVKQTWF